MALGKSVTVASPKVWTVAELGVFYTEHRSELLTHANRVLKDSAKAEEITQDALIKFMLAVPELESTDHALCFSPIAGNISTFDHSSRATACA